MRLSEIGEKSLIKYLAEELKLLGLDHELNDVHYLEIDGRLLAVSIDGYCESTWMLPFLTWRDAGRKATYAAISDILVKFARPTALSVSLCFTREHTIDDVKAVLQGVTEVVHRMNMRLLKIDTNEGKEFSIHICVIGEAKRKISCKLKPRQHIYTVPMYGYTGIVFKLLAEGKLDEFKRDPVVRRGIDILRETLVPEWIDILDSEELVNMTEASTDTSDGLGAALWMMAENSNVIIDVNVIPAPEEVVEFCKQNNIDLVEAVFNGAEDYLPLIVTGEELPKHVTDSLSLVKIGHVVERGSSLVRVRGSLLRFRGWEYFRY